MCKEHDVPFLVDGITSVGGLPVHLEVLSVEAVVMGAQKCTALIWHCGIGGLTHLPRSDGDPKRGGAPGYYLDLPAALKAEGMTRRHGRLPSIWLWAKDLAEPAIDEGLNTVGIDASASPAGVRQLFHDLGFTSLPRWASIEHGHGDPLSRWAG